MYGGTSGVIGGTVQSQSGSSRDKNTAGNVNSTQTTARPIVEVIGISNRGQAEKVAYQATRSLAKRGEDLLDGKIVINAKTKEVSKVPFGSGDLPSDKSAARHPIGASTSSQPKPSASFNSPERDVDPNDFHRQHEKVKEKLEEYADEGLLGNVPGDGELEPNITGSTAAGTKPKPTHGENFTSVSVVGVEGTEKARSIASGAVSALKGRPDVLSSVNELKVNAQTGAITDEKGQFLAQLGRGHGLVSDSRVPPKAVGGAVTPPAVSKGTEGSHSSTSQRGNGTNGQKPDSFGSGDTVPSNRHPVATQHALDDSVKMPGSFV